MILENNNLKVYYKFMGCFNKVGFYSNLPIKCQDDIVYFICATFCKLTDNTYCHDMVEPICLPIFGKYDEYGSIDDIIKDKNVIAIEKLFGNNIERIINIIEECQYFSLNDIENNRREIKTRKEPFIKDYENILSKLINTLNFYSLSPNDVSLCVTMEHKSVYDEMCTLFGENNDKVSKVFDNLVSVLENNNINVNIFKRYLGLKDYESLKKVVEACKNDSSKENEKKLEETLESLKLECKIDKLLAVFSNHSYVRDFYFEMMFYNLLNIKFSEIKDDVINFLYFNRSLSLLCGKYICSSYGLQSLTEFKEELLKMNGCYRKIIEKLEY